MSNEERIREIEQVQARHDERIKIIEKVGYLIVGAVIGLLFQAASKLFATDVADSAMRVIW